MIRWWVKGRRIWWWVKGKGGISKREWCHPLLYTLHTSHPLPFTNPSSYSGSLPPGSLEPPGRTGSDSLGGQQSARKKGRHIIGTPLHDHAQSKPPGKHPGVRLGRRVSRLQCPLQLQAQDIQILLPPRKHGLEREITSGCVS